MFDGTPAIHQGFCCTGEEGLSDGKEEE